jgi:hypothetical protein
MTKNINKTVNVMAFRFAKNRMYPQRIEVDGREYEFIDSGLCCKIQSGDTFRQVLSLTDGLQQFILRSDGRGGLWTLLSMSA